MLPLSFSAKQRLAAYAAHSLLRSTTDSFEAFSLSRSTPAFGRPLPAGGPTPSDVGLTRSGSYFRQRSLTSFRAVFRLRGYALQRHYTRYLGMPAPSGTGGSCLTFERQIRLQERQSPLRFAGGGFFISGFEMFTCVCIDLMRAEEMSMSRSIAIIAASGVFAEHVDDAVRASTAASREAREP